MRSKSPELMSEIKKYIEDYYLQNRQSPSTTKIAEAVGIARGTAYKYLVEMAEKNMIEAGIDDGDLVVVKKQVEANDGDIVVALVDNQNTLKRYFRDDENKKIILHPENKKMKDIIVDECCIQGVACHIIKEL